MGSIPTPASTHTHECGYGFHVGMGVGWHDVTHGLPTMNTKGKQCELPSWVDANSAGEEGDLFSMDKLDHDSKIEDPS